MGPVSVFRAAARKAPTPLRRIARRAGLHSIQGRLTAIAVLFIFGTALTMGLLGFNFAANFERQRFGEHFQLLATNLAGNAELGVLLGNRNILRGLTDNMLAVRDVEWVEIRDENEQVIISREAARPSSGLGYATAPVVLRRLAGENSPFLADSAPDQQLGTVSIGYSLQGIEQLKRQLATGFLLLSLLLGMVPLFFYWRLSRAIRAPLNGVLDVAGKVSQGQLDVRADGGTLLETETLATAFNDMLDALQQQRRQIQLANEQAARQQVLAEVGKFSLTVAHEIKNPLAIINGSLQILRKDEPVSAELKTRMLGFIDEEIARINRLIEDFLLFARPRPVALQPISVVELSRLLGQRIVLLDQKIEFSREIPATATAVSVRCDLAQFERALFNVVRNALDLSPLPGTVSVAIHLGVGWLYFVVTDQGPGIAAEQREKIFEPFVTGKSKGTGLGLAIAKDVMTAHHGHIQVADNPAGGACFTLSLPLAKDADEPANTAANHP